MAFSNISQLALGNYLQIAFVEGVHKQISVTYPEWEMVERMRVGSVDGREARFLMQTALGYAAAQNRNPGIKSDFPAGDESTISEGTLDYKELDATIQLEYNLYRRILESKSKYDASALAMEVDAKMTVLKRLMCQQFYGDGTGCLGRISSVSISGGRAVVTLRSNSTDQGFAGWFQFGDKVNHKAAAGTAGSSVTLGSGTFSYWRVYDRNTTSGTNTVTLDAYDNTDTKQTVNSWSPTTGEQFVRNGQPTVANLTSISDYGTATEALCGLDGLIRNDGGTTHGIVLSGATAGTVYDNGAALIDTNTIEQAMNQALNAVGAGRYKWPKMLCNRETRSAFIDSRETDRRFNSSTDSVRGTSKFTYQHEDDAIELQGSEFCPHFRAYILPEGKSDGQKVLQFRGTDFKPARAENGDVFMFAPSSSGGVHQRMMVSYLSGMGQLLSLHPAACIAINNFKLS